MKNSVNYFTIKPIYKIIILIILITFSKSLLTEAQTHNTSGNQIVFQINPGPNNPRNSEGDFITLKNGNILFIYSHFTGNSGGDFGNAYLACRYSTDQGRTWSVKDQIIVKQEGDINVMSVSLLRLKDGSIALFYARKNSDEDLIPMLRISKDESKTWSDPITCITDRRGYFVLNNNRVIQLRNGRLLMPVALHKVPGGKWSSIGRLFSYYSDDDGKTWKSGEEVPNPNKIITQEPGVIEQKNDNILMFIRTNAGVQYFSHSTDNGETWSQVIASDIKSPMSPASIARIPSTGDLLMVWNNNGVNQKRTPLNIAISRDEGKTWANIKTLENDPDGSFCYTAIHFTGKNVLLGYSNWATMGSTILRLSLKWIYKKR
jgi:predicted neuraminidase